jgi:hypothetical protein
VCRMREESVRNEQDAWAKFAQKLTQPEPRWLSPSRSAMFSSHIPKQLSFSASS